MHPSGSMIYSILETMRYLIGEATADKYDDDFCVRAVIGPEYAFIIENLSMSSGNPLVVRRSITVPAGTRHVVLPPGVHEVWRLAKLGERGDLTEDFYPMGQWHPYGPGWFLEGNLLSFRPYPATEQTWVLWYVPSGDIPLHYAKTGSTSEAGSTSRFTLASPVTVGMLDERESAYEGQVLRYLGKPVQERIIEAYDAATRTCTLRNPITVPGTTGHVYEIAPLGWQMLWQAIAARAAMNLGTARGASEKKMRALDLEYQRAMKGIRDKLTNFNQRMGHFMDKNTADNPDRWRVSVWELPVSAAMVI